MVLFADIVGFSKLETSIQRPLIDSISGIVHHEVRDLFLPPRQEPGVIALPTGDGMAVAFLEESAIKWDFARVMCLAYRLFTWASEQQKKLKLVEGLKLRIGIHGGPLVYVTDINGQPNIFGDTINFTQWVMDAANADQLLISQHIFDAYLTGDPKPRKFDCADEVSFSFYGPYDVLAKHGRRITVYSAAGDRNGELFTAPADDEPISKGQALLTLTSLS